MNLICEIKNIFQRNADKIFLIDSQTDRTFSYGDFYRMARSLSEEFVNKGVCRHDRIAMIMNNSAEFAVLYFGCLFSGATAVPINPGLHPREIDFIIKLSGAKILLYSPSTENLADLAARQGCETLGILPYREKGLADNESLWSEVDRAHTFHDEWNLSDTIEERDLFSINFTSGTTSVPKGVAHRISGLLGNAMAFNEEYGITSGNRFLHVLPMGYMAGFLNTLLCPFMAGASVVLAGQFDAASALRFWDPVFRHGADTFWLTPTILSILLRIDRNRESAAYCRESMKKIFVGTAPLPLNTKNDFEKKYRIELFESYGLSELLFISANSERYPRVSGSVGRVLPDIQVRIGNESSEEQPRGHEGEILIKTPYATAGYVNAGTSQIDAINDDEWFPTGDIGCLDADGNLFITARKKDLIIRGGINISPRAIEEVILQHASVDEVAVIGLPHEFYGEEIVALIKFKPGFTLESEGPDIQTICKHKLSAHSVPTRMLVIDRFPVSTTGKIQKNVLRAELLGKHKKESMSADSTYTR